MYKTEDYEAFSKMMEEKYPSMFDGPYGGFGTGPGWWHIIEALCKNIHGYVERTNSTRALLLKDNPYNVAIPQEIQPVIVRQIKEKFGGLRFYYDGGDKFIHGLTVMAESFSYITCEECGTPGTVRSGGWIKTLCDLHEQERQQRKSLLTMPTIV
jgi:hypothetical protein